MIWRIFRNCRYSHLKRQTRSFLRRNLALDLHCLLLAFHHIVTVHIPFIPEHCTRCHLYMRSWKFLQRPPRLKVGPIFCDTVGAVVADVLSDSSKLTVKRAYKAMALKTHPDRVPPEQKVQAEAAFQKVSCHRFWLAVLDSRNFESNTLESHRSMLHTKFWSTIPRGRNTIRLAVSLQIQARARRHPLMVKLVSSIHSDVQPLVLEQKVSSMNTSASEPTSILHCSHLPRSAYLTRS